ncbi:MAG TPA: sterol desaturase family protein [Gammaproteobacteria bacterium]|nr:sterol desaturase family protein [Gammaproteobacteria bacterium]
MENVLENFTIDSEAGVRLGCFVAIFAVMLVWELIRPRRVLTVSRRNRWPANLGLLAINTLLLRLLFPAAAVGLAYSAADLQWGLFNRIDLPYWLEVAAAVLLLDLGIYGQHLAMHRVPLLWRLHRVHHADLDIDLTTGSRFHSIEILLSMLYKWLLILLLGPALFAVLVFELLLNGMALFNHANVRLPAGVDRVLRALLVTPDMHRVHHSILRRETDSNYGFNLSFWDRIFKTYVAEPAQGHDGMTIGIPDFRDLRQVDGLPGMLTLPFVARP